VVVQLVEVEVLAGVALVELDPYLKFSIPWYNFPMAALQFNVIFEVDEDGYYVASVPAIPGCYTQGKTLEEAKKRVKEVIKLCLR